MQRRIIAYKAEVKGLQRGAQDGRNAKMFTLNERDASRDEVEKVLLLKNEIEKKLRPCQCFQKCLLTIVQMETTLERRGLMAPSDKGCCPFHTP